jgi:hypothetical protein
MTMFFQFLRRVYHRKPVRLFVCEERGKSQRRKVRDEVTWDFLG